MDFSEEWKSLFPIGSVFRAPLLLSNDNVGPLFFNPKPQTLTQLFNSPLLCPPLLNPPPQLTLPRFLSTSTTPESPIPLSTASSIASLFGPQHLNDADSLLAHNRLQFLVCPNRESMIVFFSTGSNHDQVGFLLLSVNGKTLNAVGDENGGVFMAAKQFKQKILRILVNPVMDCFEGKSILPSEVVTIGFLLVHTMYAVHWFCVNISGVSQRPVLGYLGCKIFKSCAIASACWNPHLATESIVLLENGALFLFDLESRCSREYFCGTRLKVAWDDLGGSTNCKWLGCEFSWHPRILIVAHSDSVFLVDWRDDVCRLTCLMKIGMFGAYAPEGNEHFLALCKAASDQFHFVLTTDTMLFLCDVRKPLMPMLQWTHGLKKPCYIDVVRLSELRSNSKDGTHEWATASGFGIIAGSFWNCEFSLFCFGPPLPGCRGPIASEISKISKSIYAWEHPSGLLLSGNECRCGSCLVKGEFVKDAFPEWVDWQQKKDIVLGFGILSDKISSKLFGPDEFGGFTLIKLMSSGRLELQGYCASWDLVTKFDAAHGVSLNALQKNFLYSMVDEEYKFPKRYKYLRLEYLNAYLNGNLSSFLDLNLTKCSRSSQVREFSSHDFHEILCEKLKTCGFSRLRTSPTISVVLNDINLPTSIHEVALRTMWSSLPMELLQLAFSTYDEFLDVLLDKKKVSLEFLVVPDLPQLPPFLVRKPSSRSSRWTHKVQKNDMLVGPVLPLPILLTLHEFRNGCLNSQEEIGEFSAEMELTSQCNEVIQVAKEVAVLDSNTEFHIDDDVSLGDVRVDMPVDSRPKSFFLHQPVVTHCSNEGQMQSSSYIYKDDRFQSLISKVHNKHSAPSNKVETATQELFDDLCPIELKFDTTVMTFASQELKAYNLLKKHFSKWQDEFDPYRSFCTQLITQKK